MIVFLNDAFVPEEQAVVSIFDRSFRYGDGLFETLLVANGKLFRWAEHAARLEGSAEALSIPLPHGRAELFQLAHELITRNAIAEGLLRLQVSRGVGPRGYAPTGGEKTTVVMTLHPLAPRNALPAAGWKLTVCSLRVAADDLLAKHKSCNRLLQVLAASEASARHADEALLVNTNGDVAEGSTSNVFWIEGGTVCTPPLATGALRGVTRGVILEICATLGVPRKEKNIRPDQLAETDGVVLSLTSRGVVEATSIDGKPLRRSSVTSRLQTELEERIARECG